MNRVLVKNRIHRLSLLLGSGKVHYKIRYDPACNDKKPPPDVDLQSDYLDVSGKKALNVMRRAVDLKGKDYQFSTTYSSSKTGFFVVKLNGVENTKKCAWEVSTINSKGTLKKSRNGIFNLFVQEDSTLVMTYQKKKMS